VLLLFVFVSPTYLCFNELIGIKDRLMKKCILMFALLIAALVVAVWMENNRQITSNPDLMISENHIKSPAFDLQAPTE
jgi:hypothetical protein